MTAAALAQIGHSSHEPHGWVASMLLHVLALGVSLLLFSELKPAAQPEPFRWEISLAQISPPSPQVDPTPLPPQPKPVVQPTPPPKPVESKPVVQRVQTVQTVQRIEPVVRNEEAVQQINPVVESIAQHAEPVQQERHTERNTEAVQRTEAVEVPVAAVTTPAPISPPTPVSEPEPAAVVSEVISQHEPVTTSEPVVSEAPALTQQRTVEQSAPQTVEAPAPVVQTARETPSESVIERPAMVTPQRKADYSWLTQELLSRLERSKRYPYTARMNRWEGRVVVQAVVRDDGQVVSLRIAESSGHAVLDNDAMELIRKISPLQLKHPLGQAQVALLVPVGYSLH